MRLVVFLVLTVAAVVPAIVQQSYGWLIPAAVFLLLALAQLDKPKPKPKAIGATGAVAGASWWADGHAHGKDGDDERCAAGGCEA